MLFRSIYGSCFCIHSASLCLLVGAFNPFIFKVIINMYVPITIFLIVLGLLFFFFPKIIFIYLFWAALGLCCSVRASHCGGSSCCRARALGARASVVVARGLSSCGSRAPECRLSSCGARA